MTEPPDPILGVAPFEPDPGGADPELEQPAPAPEEAPAGLDSQGRMVVVGVLKMEGEMVRALRAVPPEEPDAWRWTDSEISALMPALEGLAERYGVVGAINDHAPTAGAAIALVMHTTRSLAAERAWSAEHDTPEQQEPVDGFDPAPAPEPDREPEPGPDDGPPGGQPGSGLGPAQIARVADHLGGPRVGRIPR